MNRVASFKTDFQPMVPEGPYKGPSTISKEMWDSKCCLSFSAEVVFWRDYKWQRLGITDLRTCINSIYLFSGMEPACLTSCLIKPYVPKTDIVTLIMCIVSINWCMLAFCQYRCHGLANWHFHMKYLRSGSKRLL